MTSSLEEEEGNKNPNAKLAELLIAPTTVQQWGAARIEDYGLKESNAKNANTRSAEGHKIGFNCALMSTYSDPSG